MADVLDDRQTHRFVPWAKQLGTLAATHAARHDQEGSFAAEAFESLRESGYLALPVPVDLGGHGASLEQVVHAQAALAESCAATALASSMHLHVVTANAWRWRRGITAVESILRRVAHEHLVVISTGGTDRSRPAGQARRVAGGWRVNGRKRFASGCPAADLVSTWFTVDDRQRILGMAIPTSTPGVSIDHTWDTLGMRATGSDDLVFTDVFVPDSNVTVERPYGELDPILRLAYIHAGAIIAATYWGLARRSIESTLETIRTTATGDLEHIAAGHLTSCLSTMRWTMHGMLADLGDDPGDSVDNVIATMLAKRTIAVVSNEICDHTAELLGGRTYYRSAPYERAWRDLRAARYHPWSPNETLQQAGRHMLRLSASGA